MRPLFITAVALLASCVSTSNAARQDALMPAVVLAWGDVTYGVKSDTLRGIQDAVEDGDLYDKAPVLLFVDQMDTALSSRDADMIARAPWAVLKGYAGRGIEDRVEDGELVEQAAVLLRRRLANFDEAVLRLSHDGPWPVVSVRTNLRLRVATPQGKLPLVASLQN